MSLGLGFKISLFVAARDESETDATPDTALVDDAQANQVIVDDAQANQVITDP